MHRDALLCAGTLDGAKSHRRRINDLVNMMALSIPSAGGGPDAADSISIPRGPETVSDAADVPRAA
jgi:hypothetical protein